MDPNDDKHCLFKSKYNINFQINPEEYGLDFVRCRKSSIDLTMYSDISEIYKDPMAPTAVSLGTLPSSNEKIVIKQIFKEYLINDFLKTQGAQEFPLHCSLKHDNIVKGIEWSENDDEYILIMEYMNKAEYFEDKIVRDLCPVKNENKMKSYMSDVLEGLGYLHSKGIVHGDIKLQNMLMQKNEEESIPIVKLSDFGLSRPLSKETGKFYMEFPVGTKNYMAPEIKSKAQVDEKIDMWALGVSLYKMSVAYLPTQIAGYKYGLGQFPLEKWIGRKDLLSCRI